MKLILESTDLAMLMEKSALLESRGIPTHLDNVPHVGAVPSHLYVILDEHLEDARALLENADHPVRNPVYPDDLEALAERRREIAREDTEAYLPQLLAGFFLCVAAAAVVRWLSVPQG